ncbi:MAG: endonuclease/exonuclease/phosphatase family protein [Anaerolineae bacterium]|jgi:endonuclease/exonuclease/phosphatase family metal-dependent hydrolase|nr:endonuclease/exonuclease/phosphatase family protein [Anaerolineae bacterium]
MKIATLNLRHHMDRWEERFPLVVQTLLDADADLVGLQEVSIKLGPKNQAQMIADKIQKVSGTLYNVYFTRTREVTKDQEGIAILSQYPLTSTESIALPGPWRVAQRITVEIEGRTLGFTNTHLHHEPWRDESIRLPQVQSLMDWVNTQPFPCVISGDFNAEPDSATILKVKETHRSAYESIHGTEPDFTYPTPLVQPVPAHTNTIDYLFYAPDALSVTACEKIGTKSAPHDATLYPSDHFGLLAELNWAN